MDGFLRLSDVGRKGAARRSHTALTLNGNKNSMHEPAKRGARRAFTVPWIWWSGRTCSRWSEPVYFQACKRDWLWAVSTELGRSTPFWR